jgi:hypothetical protein
MSSTLNPTARKTITKTVCIDSLFRTNLEADSANFTFSLAEPINNVLSMKLTTMELPNNWYLFSSKNQSNVFSINCYNVPVLDEFMNYTFTQNHFTHKITLPEGNYLDDTFHKSLMHYFRNIGNGLEFINVCVNSINARVEFSTGRPGSVLKVPLDPYKHYYKDLMDESTYGPTNTGFYFTLDFSVPSKPLYRTIGWAMGFMKSFYTVKYTEPADQFIDIISDSAITYSAFLASESSFGSTLSHYIFLEIDDFQRNVSPNTIVSYNGNGDSYLNNNILAKIVVSSGQWTSIIDNAGDYVYKKRIYYGPVKLEKLHIKLRNRFGEVLDLNWNDFSFSLELEVNYS